MVDIDEGGMDAFQTVDLLTFYVIVYVCMVTLKISVVYLMSIECLVSILFFFLMHLALNMQVIIICGHIFNYLPVSLTVHFEP